MYTKKEDQIVKVSKNENKKMQTRKKATNTQQPPMINAWISIPSWKRLLVFFGIYLLVLGVLKTVEYFSEGLQKIEGSLDLRSSGYSSDPPEIEVFELIEKMGSEGRTSHLIMQFIDQFLFVPIYCVVHCYVWLKIGEGLFSPLMYILVALTALVDTAENLSIIVLLLTYPFLSGVVNVKELAGSTRPLSTFPTSQMILKALARGLHYFTPYKFMLIGLFFLTMLVMTILSHIMVQASEEEEEKQSAGDNKASSTTATTISTLKISSNTTTSSLPTDPKKNKKKTQ